MKQTDSFPICVHIHIPLTLRYICSVLCLSNPHNNQHRRLHGEELHHFYPTPKIVRVIKWKKINARGM